jgi:hypothetical protein
MEIMYANHKKSLNVPRYSAETESSKYAWKLKKSGKQYNIKWSILKRAHAYTAGAARCNLCLEEKVCLLEADKNRILNKRSELFAKCCHRNTLACANLNAHKMHQQTVSDFTMCVNCAFD